MKCRDFERLINEQHDSREPAPTPAPAPAALRAHAALAEAMAAHEAACPACRATVQRYQVLREAVAVWSQHPPLPSPDFAARFPRDWEQTDCTDRDAVRSAVLAFPRVLRPIAAAAVLMLAVWVGAHSLWPGKPPGRPGAAPVPAPRAVAVAVHPIDPDAVSTALAEATSATWDLARATSAPAARVGREVLDAAGLPESATGLVLPDEPGPTTEVFESVTARVNEGVGPLSGTARHAFGFLLGNSGG